MHKSINFLAFMIPVYHNFVKKDRAMNGTATVMDPCLKHAGMTKNVKSHRYIYRGVMTSCLWLAGGGCLGDTVHKQLKLLTAAGMFEFLDGFGFYLPYPFPGKLERITYLFKRSRVSLSV